jgi:5-methyltetrahydropteroyltriglutamate--homocysteine methyltransferase
VKSWFAFALQKCAELALLRDALNSGDTGETGGMERADSGSPHSTRVHNAAVEKRLAAITAQDSQRNSPMQNARAGAARAL